MCMLNSKSGGCVMCECVSVFACHQLTNSLVEEGSYFIQLGIMVKVGGQRGRTVFFLSVNLNISCQRVHCLLPLGVVALWKSRAPGWTLMVSTRSDWSPSREWTVVFLFICFTRSV